MAPVKAEHELELVTLCAQLMHELLAIAEFLVTVRSLMVVQVESAVERDSWIEAVNAVVKLSNDVKVSDAATSDAAC